MLLIFDTMAITKQKKEEIVKELTEAFKNARVSIFADFRGTDVTSLNAFRSKIRETGGTFKVAKKTLITRSLDEASITGINPKELEGEIGVVFGMKDAASTGKAANEQKKTGETFKILGGFMDGAVLTVGDIIQLATLPSRLELLAKFVGSINAPRYGFVRVLSGNVRGLVYALNAIAQNK